MTAGPLDPPPEGRDRLDDDPTIVPGLDAPGRRAPLDMSQDPDRFDPLREPPAEAPRGLDPALDPDRFTTGEGQSLTDLIGKAATFEGERDNYQWAIGLFAVFAFLGLVAFLFNSVLSP